jgi:hypothetical protein
MSVARQRKEKAKRIALDLGAKYRGLVEAKGEDEIGTAAILLGDCFNTHIEFIINALRDYGGLETKWEPMTKIEQPPILQAANIDRMDAAELAEHYKRDSDKKLN